MAISEVAVWRVIQVTLKSANKYANPLGDVSISVRFLSPTGTEYITDAFWDGEDTWRVRFSPNEMGDWEWHSECSGERNAGLHGQSGEFRCVPYDGDTPLYIHGPVQSGEGMTHLQQADETPYFWLSDTAWNGALRSKMEDWHEYLQNRRAQGYTAIQFVSTQWRGCSSDPKGQMAFTGGDPVSINPEFFQRMEEKVQAINEHGMIAVPVILWAFGEADPGQALSEDDAIRVARYIRARWGAYQVIWFLGGDGHYEGERAERWRNIGRAVFDDAHRRPVTMHPCGQSWVGDEFRDEPWFDFIGYQSGHGDSDDHLRWLVEGPPANEWDAEPQLPVINLEPNYETHPAYHSNTRFDDYHVRRAAYWSLLVSPTAGVSYGHNAIWVWADEAEVPEGHDSIGEVEPWRKGLNAAGARSMSVMKNFVDSIDWWRLRPAQELLLKQPGTKDVENFIAVAAAQEGDLVVAYLPKGGSISLRNERFANSLNAHWYNPRDGNYQQAEETAQETATFTAPAERDWLLVLKR